MGRSAFGLAFLLTACAVGPAPTERGAGHILHFEADVGGFQDWDAYAQQDAAGYELRIVGDETSSNASELVFIWSPDGPSELAVAVWSSAAITTSR